MNNNSNKTFFPQYYRTRKENAVYHLFSQNKFLVTFILIINSFTIALGYSRMGNITFTISVISVLLSLFFTTVILILIGLHSFNQNDKLLTEDMKEKVKIADDKIKYRRKVNKQQKAHKRKSISLI